VFWFFEFGHIIVWRQTFIRRTLCSRVVEHAWKWHYNLFLLQSSLVFIYHQGLQAINRRHLLRHVHIGHKMSLHACCRMDGLWILRSNLIRACILLYCSRFASLQRSWTKLRALYQHRPVLNFGLVIVFKDRNIILLAWLVLRRWSKVFPLHN